MKFLEAKKECLNSINNFRIIKGMKRLEVDTINRIPEFIVNKPIELLLNSKENIFNYMYLFKYPKGIFEKEFNKGNESIINILIDNNLNNIQIINEGDYHILRLVKICFLCAMEIELNHHLKKIYIDIKM